MSLHPFFESFPLLLDAPNGVAKVRDLILQLAFEGKLIPQNPDAESASVLLEKIKSEKQHLVREGKIKQQRSIAIESDEKISFALPFGWVQTTLGDLAHKITDGTHKTPTYVEKGVPFLSVKDFSGGSLDFSHARYIPAEEHSLLYKRCDPRRGDILLGRIGTLGKAVLIDTDKEFSLFVSVALIRFSHNLVSPSFLRLLLNSPLVATEFHRIKVGGGTHTNKLNLADLHTVIIPLPPLEEQKRIVAKVDELMRLCDELEGRKQARRESRTRLNNATLAPLNNAASLAPEEFEQASVRLADNFEALYDSAETVGKLRSTILQLAVQGKLVPQDPLDEHAKGLLKVIALEKMRLNGEKTKRQPRITQSDEEIEGPFKLPDSWLWTRFGDVTINRDGERVPIEKSIRHGQQGIYDYYGASGVIDKIDNYLFDEPLLLIGEDGANLINRATPIAFIAKGKYWVNNHAHVLDSISLNCLEYLEVFINATDLRPYITGTAQPKMNQAKMNSILVALAPEQEQKRIVAKVNQLMALCEELEAKLRQAEADSEKLMKTAVQYVLASITERSSGILSGASA